MIDENGSQAGITSVQAALERAERVGLDLVEISDKSDPPVCKILDFGKFRYELQKQKKMMKKNQHVIQVKEIRVRPNTDDHDLLTKMNKAQKFLLSGDKLKVTVMFRGREMSRKEAGRELLDRVINVIDTRTSDISESKLRRLGRGHARRVGCAAELVAEAFSTLLPVCSSTLRQSSKADAAGLRPAGATQSHINGSRRCRGLCSPLSGSVNSRPGPGRS